jgi:ribosome-associated translation inhibitor RaiA
MNIKILVRIVFVIMLAVFVLHDAARVNAQSKISAARIEAERISRDQFQYSTKTKRGAKVFSVNKPSAEMLAAIDKGFEDLFKVARKYKYRSRLKFKDYTVFIAKPDRQKDRDGNYSPDIAVAANQYAGTIFDQGGFIYAAGMVVSNDPCAFLIGEHTKNFERVSNVVRYEGEHIVLFHNDRAKYESTKDHSRGGAHPILQ